jgi:hypothetical protein
MWAADKRHGRGQLQCCVCNDGSSVKQVESGYWENDVFVGDRFVANVPPPAAADARAVAVAQGTSPATGNGAAVAKGAHKRIVPCRNWAATGSCPFGDGCHFKDSHTT